MGADQNFFRNRSVGLYPKNTASPRTWVSENSYGQAISKQKTQVATRKQNEMKHRPGLQRPIRPVEQTGQIGRAGNSNCRPVAQTGRSQTARQQSSKCQISSKRSSNPTKLGGKLRYYPVNISPKDLTQKIHRSREIEERSKRIGVFLEHKIANS